MQKEVKKLATQHEYITNTLLEPLTNQIEIYLKQLYPNLSNEQASDWSLEFVNFPNNHTGVFKRMNKLFKREI